MFEIEIFELIDDIKINLVTGAKVKLKLLVNRYSLNFYHTHQNVNHLSPPFFFNS